MRDLEGKHARPRLSALRAIACLCGPALLSLSLIPASPAQANNRLVDSVSSAAKQSLASPELPEAQDAPVTELVVKYAPGVPASQADGLATASDALGKRAIKGERLTGGYRTSNCPHRFHGGRASN
ncbi:MAG: hypothetical protein HQ526_09065 [Actinobacteria bacterium]|nr:hypothetical protein [Actinomycetota bacterium]